MYASFLRISRALHLDVFEQPAKNYFFNNLLAHKHRRKGKSIPAQTGFTRDVASSVEKYR
jgi:hypothetical protein